MQARLNLYDANVHISQINGVFAGFEDIIETCKVFASNERKAKKEALNLIKAKYSYLKHVSFVFSCKVCLLIENVKIK